MLVKERRREEVRVIATKCGFRTRNLYNIPVYYPKRMIDVSTMLRNSIKPDDSDGRNYGLRRKRLLVVINIKTLLTDTRNNLMEF